MQCIIQSGYGHFCKKNLNLTYSKSLKQIWCCRLHEDKNLIVLDWGSMHKSNKVHQSLDMILFYEPHTGCLSRGSQLEHMATLQTRLLQEEMLVVFDQFEHILLKKVDCATSWH